jgi:hypothetical protein
VEPKEHGACPRPNQAIAPLVLYPVHGQLHGQFPHCSAVDSAHSTPRKGLRLPEGSGPSAGLRAFRGCQFLVRGRKKQIALVAVFGANRSAFAVNFHPVSALWTGEPNTAFGVACSPPKPFDAQNKSWTQSIYGPACCLRNQGCPISERGSLPSVASRRFDWATASAFDPQTSHPFVSLRSTRLWQNCAKTLSVCLTYIYT